MERLLELMDNFISLSRNQMAWLSTFKDKAAYGLSGKYHQTATLNDLTTWRHPSP